MLCRFKNRSKSVYLLFALLSYILDCKEIKPVDPKGNQPWILIAGTDAEASILWPPDVKSWLTGKDPDAGKDWGHEEKGMTEDEMAGWHHRLNGHGFGWTPGVGDGQGSRGVAVHGVAKSQTRLSDWTELIQILSELSYTTLMKGKKGRLVWM